MKEKKVKWHLRVFIDVDGLHEEVGIFGYYNLQDVVKETGVSEDTLARKRGQKIPFKRFDDTGEYVFFVLTKN